MKLVGSCLARRLHQNQHLSPLSWLNCNPHMRSSVSTNLPRPIAHSRRSPRISALAGKVNQRGIDGTDSSETRNAREGIC